MKKKVISKKRTPKKTSIINEIENEVQEIEQWIIERKKFFIKLVWTVGLITALIILSNVYLRTKGVGI